MKTALSAGGALVLVVGLAVGLAALGVWIYSFTAPAYVHIENKTFHQSQAYTDGMARDLFEMKDQWDRATPDGRDSIRASVRERFVGFDITTLPPSLRAFAQEMGL